MVHAAALIIDSGDEVYLLRKGQIDYPKANETPTKVPSEYADFADIFSPKLAAKLPEHGISNYAIELVDNQ